MCVCESITRGGQEQQAQTTLRNFFPPSVLPSSFTTHPAAAAAAPPPRHRDLPRHSSFSYYHITEQLQTNRNVCVEHPFCAFSSCLVDGAHRCPNRLRLDTQQDVVGRDVVVWLEECRYWPGTQTRIFLRLENSLN